MQNLQIKDIYFGKIDGYNEFLEYGQDTCKGLFMSFLILIYHAYLMAQHIISLETKALVKPCFSNTSKV